MNDTNITTPEDDIFDEPIHVEIIRERIPRIEQCARGAEPKAAAMHTIWMSDSHRKIQEWKNKGFRMAKMEDIDDLQVGWMDKSDNVIRDGDLVLMIGQREPYEQRHIEYRRELKYQGGASVRDDMIAGAEAEAEHGRTVKGRFYPAP